MCVRPTTTTNMTLDQDLRLGRECGVWGSASAAGHEDQGRARIRVET